METRKTGTTIVGIKYNSGVVMCADTRATMGDIVADPNTSKIAQITDNIFCCGSGCSADTERVMRKASREMQLFYYKHLETPYICHCQKFIKDYLYGYRGQIVAGLVLGGVDKTGPHVYSISPNGYSTEKHYAALGSGSIAAAAVLDHGYRLDISREDALHLGVEAVKAGILYDLYSGSNIDVCVIDEKKGAEYYRNYLSVCTKPETEDISPHDISSIKILKEDVFKYVEEMK